MGRRRIPPIIRLIFGNTESGAKEEEERHWPEEPVCFLATRDTKIVGRGDSGYASHIHWPCVSGDVITALRVLRDSGCFFDALLHVFVKINGAEGF